MANTHPASRTPEGEPNRCPICGKEIRIEPSLPPGDAPCPHCGHLLWFAATSGQDDTAKPWPPSLISRFSSHMVKPENAPIASKPSDCSSNRRVGQFRLLTTIGSLWFRVSLAVMAVLLYLGEGHVDRIVCATCAAAIVVMSALAGLGLALRDHLRYRLRIGQRVNPLLRLYFAAGWISFLTWIATSIGLAVLLVACLDM